MSIYQDKGYLDREEYLLSLPEGFEIDEHTVQELADLYGEGEDFDGLVAMLKDSFGEW